MSQQRETIFNFIRAMSLVRRPYIDPKTLVITPMLTSPLHHHQIRSAIINRSKVADFVKSETAKETGHGAPWKLTAYDRNTKSLVEGKSLDGELSAKNIGYSKFPLPRSIKKFIEDPGQSIISGDASTKIRGWRVEVKGRSGLRTQRKRFNSGRLGIQDYPNTKVDFARGIFVSAKYGASGVKSWVMYE